MGVYHHFKCETLKIWTLCNGHQFCKTSDSMPVTETGGNKGDLENKVGAQDWVAPSVCTTPIPKNLGRCAKCK
ncbi:hypothetical protein EXN66_Car004832 [Channa argus]|uniref:Uncharacterized protein n=1 Tax=Channa argus TaxID=215402 RepID=A0A6G1PFT0_CHAAH|nr:hypothetical protein EXN66_Car004832 [Channa argus]